MQGFVLDVIPPPGVVVWIGTPMKSAADDIVSAFTVGKVVSTRLHDVNLAGLWPGPIGFFDRHHPDCRPHPIAVGQLSDHFHAAEFDAGSSLGGNAT